MQAYRVYLDDQFKAETGELSYSFGPLTDGWHTAGVEAVFESGSSRRALLDFQAGDVAVESAGQAGVRVSPNPATSFLSLEGDVGIWNVPVPFPLARWQDGNLARDCALT